eukprot:CAMPEP_0184382890 /NCGR_PEP_ID=MMETSP0007-20130409/6702_1 /TAXON_ID=97485 /ORGANISM="Prymnesium parvum, Strain Texoma1" /LENGTH=43 /DNA_ID= /DNA_START= /DNA_END= /DNA_ORIENTATION=
MQVELPAERERRVCRLEVVPKRVESRIAPGGKALAQADLVRLT